jgi:hypothetical protein
VRDSVRSSILRIKKHVQFFHGRGIHGIWERDALKWNWINSDKRPNEGNINSESHSPNCGLQYETALLIIYDLQVPIEILDHLG